MKAYRLLLKKFNETTGVVCTEDGGYLEASKITEINKEKLRADIPSARIFIVNEKLIMRRSSIDGGGSIDLLYPDQTTIKGLPFDICWFELMCPLERCPTSELYKTEKKLSYLGMLLKKEPNGNITVSSFCSLISAESKILGYVFKKDVIDFYNPKKLTRTAALALAYLGSLDTGSCGLSATKETVFIPRKNSDKKTPRDIRNIVYVLPKQNKESYVPKGIKIDWSHRWEVRGHWRSTTGLGKNQYGDYSEYGRTWVRDFIKGPEELPIVVKPRAVIGDKSARA